MLLHITLTHLNLLKYIYVESATKCYIVLLFLYPASLMFVLPIPVIRFYPKCNDNICISLFVARLEAFCWILCFLSK